MASTSEPGPSTSRPAVVKFQPPPLEIRSDEHQGGELRELSRENSLITPTTPGAGPSGLGVTPRDDKHEKKKIGHRRVLETGEITYKKVPTSQLMGAIQLGIANAIGSLASKPERDLLMQDFSVIENIYFPSEGSNTTPSHSFSDFRFKSYAPIAFRYFRDLFHIKPADFLASLCTESLIELSNPGASGSIFYISNDDQFIIKTVQHKEAEFLQNLLAGYYMNLNQNPRTLLPKFFGLYCYQSLGKNVRLCVMNNLLPSTIRMHQKYDLKGSTYKRRASKYERAKESPTLKDLDFMEDHQDGVYLEASTYEALMRTIQRDCLVLESFKIMDYSLLMGIHNLDAPQKEAAIEEVQLQLDGTQAVSVSGGASDGETSQKKPDPKERKVVRQKTRFSAWESIQTEALPVELGDEYPNGGIPARSAKGERLLLFIGIIDILQSYRLFKKFEHAWKSVLHDGDTISVHRPSFYASRFQEFARTKVFKKIPSPFKHSPSKRKSRERRGTASSTEERQQRTSTGDIAPAPVVSGAHSARPDLVPTTAAGGEQVASSEHRPSVRKLTFDMSGRPLQRQDTYESKESKRVERLFASSHDPASGTKQRTSVSISGTDTVATLRQRQMSSEDDGEPKPLETTL